MQGVIFSNNNEKELLVNYPFESKMKCMVKTKMKRDFLIFKTQGNSPLSIVSILGPSDKAYKHGPTEAQMKGHMLQSSNRDMNVQLQLFLLKPEQQPSAKFACKTKNYFLFV